MSFFLSFQHLPESVSWILICRVFLWTRQTLFLSCFDYNPYIRSFGSHLPSDFGGLRSAIGREWCKELGKDFWLFVPMAFEDHGVFFLSSSFLFLTTLHNSKDTYVLWNPCILCIHLCQESILLIFSMQCRFNDMQVLTAMKLAWDHLSPAQLTV